MANDLDYGQHMYNLARELFPICRSITGNGVRQTLKIIQGILPDLQLHEVPTGTQCFDWTIPQEWNIDEAYIENEAGQRIVDFREHNLHVVNYSTPIEETFPLKELEEHLYSLPDQADAIPYVTSYYKPSWGFCLKHSQREKLPEGNYKVVIRSSLTEGSLTYGEWVLPGESSREILLSSYICHPSMANNELSGPVLGTFLAKWLTEAPRKYTYRLALVPETIGAITYISKNLEQLKERTLAAFQLTCVGDERTFSFMPSRGGDTPADRVTLHVLKNRIGDFQHYSFLERGSDERQYCSPGVDLPIVSLMRSKYGEYPEYHTSLDNLDLISAQGLQGAFDLHTECLNILEHNHTYRAAFPCEAQMSRRGLRSTLGGGPLPRQTQLLSNFMAYCDGTRDLIAMAETLQTYASDLIPLVDRLLREGLVVKVEANSAKD